MIFMQVVKDWFPSRKESKMIGASKRWHNKPLVARLFFVTHLGMCLINQVKRSCDHSLEQFDPRKLGHAVILCCTIHNLRGNDDQCPFDLVVHLRFYQTRDCRFPIIASICQPIGSKQGKIITCSCSVPPSLFNLFAPFLRCFLRWYKKKRGWVKELIFMMFMHLWTLRITPCSSPPDSG